MELHGGGIHFQKERAGLADFFFYGKFDGITQLHTGPAGKVLNERKTAIL